METQKQFINPKQIYLKDLVNLIKDKTNRLKVIFNTLEWFHEIKSLEDLLLIHPEELGKKHIRMGYESTMELLTGLLENFEFVIIDDYIFLYTDHGRHWNMNKRKLQEINEVKRKIIKSNENLVDKYYQANLNNPSNLNYLKLRSAKVSTELKENQQTIRQLNKKNEELESEQIYLTKLLRNKKK